MRHFCKSRMHQRKGSCTAGCANAVQQLMILSLAPCLPAVLRHWCLCRRIAAPLAEGRKQAASVTAVDAQALKAMVEALAVDVRHRRTRMQLHG